MASKNKTIVTETETETDGDILGAIAKQKAALEATKKKGSDAGKSNNFNKRMVGGMFVANYMLWMCVMGPLYWLFAITVFALFLSKEM